MSNIMPNSSVKLGRIMSPSKLSDPSPVPELSGRSVTMEQPNGIGISVFHSYPTGRFRGTAGNHNTATQTSPVPQPARVVPSDVGYGTTVQPHERGVFWPGKRQRRVVRNTGGPDKSSDTAFHPKQISRQPNSAAQPSTAGERTHYDSFISTQHLIYDPNNQPDTPRWGTTKTGAGG